MYLADKLGVSAGYLLSRGDEDFIYNKTRVMKNIRRAYIDKNFELCRDMCLSSFEDPDDEIELLLTDCCIGVADDYMRSGQLHKACSFLDEAVIHSHNTMFDTTTQKRSIGIMFCLLKEISPALDSNETDTDLEDELLHPSLYRNMLCKYITVILDSEKYDVFESDIKKINEDDMRDSDRLFILHLLARRQMRDGDYRAALETLRAVTDSDTVPPRLLLYFACTDTEICSREVGDYKNAYESAQNKIEIMEHMLVDE